MTPTIRGLLPALPAPTPAESLRAALGAGLALLLTGWVLGHLPFGPAQALIAPFGASVFLIFAVPNSPLAQPWSVVVGSTVSALVALTVVHLIPQTTLAAGVSVALAILAMAATRSMHPPAGAIALLIALTADPAHPPGLAFALSPVADGAALLVILGMLWSRAMGRVYPFRQPAPTGPHGTSDPAADRRLGLRAEDLQTILTRLRLSPNLGPEDLGRALEAAEAQATARHLGALTAADIMSRDVVVLPPDATAHDIAQTFRRHGFNTLPVRDAGGACQGLLHDRDLIGADPAQTAATLSRPVQTLPPTAGLSDLLPLLSDGHQPSVPITDAGRLTGIVTRSDLITLLAAKIRSQGHAMTDTFQTLHHACAALGTRLFTITALDVTAGNFRRIYTSHPAEYPTSGTKPMTADGWHDHCITGRQTFVANTPPEFAKYFFDHALITSLGLGSCINIPVHDGAGPVPGPVLGTVNLLAEAQHFTPDRLAAYAALVATASPALCSALAKALTD